MLRILVDGIVQGIGFRPFVYRIAVANNLKGYVRNRSDGSVEIVIDGNDNSIKRFIDELKHQKPQFAKYNKIIISRFNDKKCDNFSIVKSDYANNEINSIIPPDLGICNNCKKELFDKLDRRYGYFFITCTNCGPRFTILEDLPYDRNNTSMKEFKLCKECRCEYEDISNRRFHAETIACTNCGPKVYLKDKNGIIKTENAIEEASKLLEKGFIVAIKGIGGFHLAVNAIDRDAVKRLRDAKERGNKPFAIMARDIETVKEFAYISKKEERLLSSYIKPIIILKKKGEYNLAPLISDLNSIGVMLPYTGLHYLLFNNRLKTIVMTSANVNDEPIINDDKYIERLKFIDYFLFHNREIVNRCDDSVIKVNRGKVSILRRSRGYVPLPIFLKKPSKKSILALGAHLNVSVSLLINNKIFVSQHIGNIDSLETYKYLNYTIDWLCKLTKTKPDIIVHDLHPTLPTTNLAYKLAEKFEAKTIAIQHHYAHLATLQAENDKDMIGIICDGFGYGEDGNAWGGEIFIANKDGYKRVGHLMEQPMIGGDLASYYPLRMIIGILNDIDGIEDYLYNKSFTLPNGRRELDIILKNVNRVKMKTTSTGRILDAISFLLDIAYERTYEGEPALKLESTAINGQDILNLEPRIKDNILDTKYLLEEIFYNRHKYKKKDLAYSAHTYIAKGLADIAITNAKKYDIKNIGFSGGVAYNEIITSIIAEEIEKHNLTLILNESIPPGDGGLSIGQAFYASNILDTRKHLANSSNNNI
ncbi:MAG: carbamoyltransferase HypF [Candidatus Nitrosocaldaceae archaeon]|nr:MAG: carbamoyltransferase HypF [Candidatus Nitrosocaldaceae archaeon]GIU72842.1 MAG: carbamoyltransferase HypF [Candidatus Nitrosocaldaceae archaeon]